MPIFESARFIRFATVLAVALVLLLSGVVVGAAGGPLIMGAANSAGITNTSLTTSSTGTALLVTQNGGGTALRGSAVGPGSIAGFFTASNGTGISGVTGAPGSYGVFAQNNGAAGTGGAVRASGGNNSGLVATTANAAADALRGINTGGGEALDLVVNAGVAPMTVNSDTKVANLNADLLDGLDSTDFAAAEAEAWQEVGAFGQCDLSGAQRWTNVDSNHNSAAYFKDPSGVVHLKGLVRCTGALNGLFDIFVLPEGSRPAKREAHGTIAGDALARIDIATDGKLILIVGGVGAATYLSLDGITFRAAP